jgi:hypothetical protein
MKTIHTIKLPVQNAAVRRSEPVPIGVAIAEAYAAIGARRRTAARQLGRQASETLRKARATG